MKESETSEEVLSAPAIEPEPVSELIPETQENDSISINRLKNMSDLEIAEFLEKLKSTSV